MPNADAPVPHEPTTQTADRPPVRPLAGRRVVECGGSTAVAYAGHLLAELGADVIKVEPPDGDPLRRQEPFVDGASPPISAVAAYYHANKVTVRLDPARDADRRRLTRLIAGADVLLRGPTDPSRPSSATMVPDDGLVTELRSAHPGLVVADVTTFGRTGPLADVAGDNLIALAESGFLSLCATSTKDPEAMPLQYPGELADAHAGCDAIVAVLGSLYGRDRDGLGDQLDVSVHEAAVSILATAIGSYTYAGVVPVHHGVRGVVPWDIYDCQDGAVVMQCTEDEQFRRLVELLGSPEWGTLEMFETTAQRIELSEALEPLVAAAIAERHVDELVAAAFEAKVPIAPIHSARDVLEWPHLAARRFFQPVEVGTESTTELMVPVLPIRFDGATPIIDRREPVEAADVEEADAADDERGAAPSRPAPAAPIGSTTTTGTATATAASSAPARPLEGVRVVDLTWVWAGPYATLQLAHLGAEVIKIESPGRVDVTRRLRPYLDEEPGVNRSAYFNQYNQGKRSVSLDISGDAGKAVLDRLIAASDVIVDNWRAGALERLGYTSEHLLSLNPRLVMASLTGFGETGPERDRLAYGSTIDALAGVNSMVETEDGRPTDFPMSLPDPCGGVHTAIGILAGLHHVAATGRGVRVECSMLESTVSAFPNGVLTVAATDQLPAVVGNRHGRMSPHGVFRCDGSRGWIAVAVDGDDQFAGLATAIGRPGLATDPRFATAADRRDHESELEKLIADWAASRDADAAVDELRANGVPAARIKDVGEVVESDHLAARRYFTELPHPEVGRRRLAGAPWKSTPRPMQVTSAAPLLGDDTDDVLGRVVGLDPAAIARLRDDGVIA